MLCQGTTVSGRPCSRSVKNRSYCFSHQPSVQIDDPIINQAPVTSDVERLREHLAMIKIGDKEIMKRPSLKSAHVYCVINNISSQKYGVLLEKYIRAKFSFDKRKANECAGDCSKNGDNIEIKVSLGGKDHTKFNYVQLRPSHDCDLYLITAYHLTLDNVDEEGELYIFKVPKVDMKNIILLYGGYAHGTIKEHGVISLVTMNKEYAIRPSFGDRCWNALMRFRITEAQI